MGWKQIADVDGEINEIKMTVRITKSDDSLKPKYSVAIGVRNDPNPFRPFLRGDVLSMGGSGKSADGTPVNDTNGLDILHHMLMTARGLMAIDSAEHRARLENAERDRIAAINGKNGGDPNANRGLNAQGKTAKKRAKEAQRAATSKT